MSTIRTVDTKQTSSMTPTPIVAKWQHFYAPRWLHMRDWWRLQSTVWPRSGEVAFCIPPRHELSPSSWLDSSCNSLAPNHMQNTPTQTEWTLTLSRVRRCPSSNPFWHHCMPYTPTETGWVLTLPLYRCAHTRICIGRTLHPLSHLHNECAHPPNRVDGTFCLLPTLLAPPPPAPIQRSYISDPPSQWTRWLQNWPIFRQDCFEMIKYCI